MHESRVEMAGRAGCDRRRDDARRVESVRIPVGREIAADRPQLQPLSCGLGGRFEHRGLACAGRAHEVDREHT